jgi:hypothetical protein
MLPFQPTVNTNGNGYDPVNDRLYYSTFTNSLLFFTDLSGTQTSAGSLVGDAANATFYRGAYYYIEEGSTLLKRATLMADGTISAEVQACNIPAGLPLGFGDIAIDKNGKLFGSAQFISNTDTLFFSIDLTDQGCSNYREITSGDPVLQIAFGEDAVLYGQVANDGSWYVINTDTGLQTQIHNCTTVTMSDLASGFPTPKINIKAGSDPNSINTCSGGNTPLTIFGSENLNVENIIPEQLVLASSQVKTVGKSQKSLCSVVDVGVPNEDFFDGLDELADRYNDLTCHFVTSELALNDTSISATLRITGCQDPTVVGDHNLCEVGGQSGRRWSMGHLLPTERHVPDRCTAPRSAASRSPAPSVGLQCASSRSSLRPHPSTSSHWKVKKAIVPMTRAEITTRSIISRLNMDSRGERGGWRNSSPSAGSKAKATSWIPLVTRFSQSNCTASSGRGCAVNRASVNSTSSAAPVEMRRKMTLRTLA